MAGNYVRQGLIGDQLGVCLIGDQYRCGLGLLVHDVVGDGGGNRSRVKLFTRLPGVGMDHAGNHGSVGLDGDYGEVVNSIAKV